MCYDLCVVDCVIIRRREPHQIECQFRLKKQFDISDHPFPKSQLPVLISSHKKAAKILVIIVLLEYIGMIWNEMIRLTELLIHMLLVGGLEHECCFPIQLGSHHPN